MLCVRWRGLCVHTPLICLRVCDETDEETTGEWRMCVRSIVNTVMVGGRGETPDEKIARKLADAAVRRQTADDFTAFFFLNLIFLL